MGLQEKGKPWDSVNERETHGRANEVRVETYALAPKFHQLRGGKLFGHQATDGFTTASPHDSDKVLHDAAKRGVLWRGVEWIQHVFSIGTCADCRQGMWLCIWNLTSHLIQQAIAGSTLKSHRHINTIYVGPNLKAFLGAGLVVFQGII